MTDSTMPYSHDFFCKIRNDFPFTAPTVIRDGPIIGMGYRSPWVMGNVVQAQTAKDLGLNIMLAQQSLREIERTGRSFFDVINSATAAAYITGLKSAWGADADHLKEESHIEEAVNAGFTHYTYDVSEELNKNPRLVVDKIHRLYRFTSDLKSGSNFTTEISLDEVAENTKLQDVISLLEELRDHKIYPDEIAPRFPGYFEKGIDYYWKIVNGRKIIDLKEITEYLIEINRISKRYGVRISIHSGSDKFSIYPVIAKVLGNNYHLKTAGTFYMEELRVVANHDPGLFKEFFNFSLEKFQEDRSSYELSTDIKNIPDILKLNNEQLFYKTKSCPENNDLRQVLHVTYGSVFTARTDNGDSRFANRIYAVLKNNKADYLKILRAHIERHLKLLDLT